MSNRAKLDLYNWLIQAPIHGLDLEQYKTLSPDEIDVNGTLCNSPDQNLECLITKLSELVTQALISDESKESELDPSLPKLEAFNCLTLYERLDIFEAVAELLNSGVITANLMSTIVERYPNFRCVFNKFTQASGNYYQLKPDLTQANMMYLKCLADEGALLRAYAVYMKGGQLNQYTYNRLPELYKQFFVRHLVNYKIKRSALGDKTMFQLKASYKF